jgi:hypothetical protein
MGWHGKATYVEVAHILACATSAESSIRMVPACDYEMVVSLAPIPTREGSAVASAADPSGVLSR